MLVKILTLTNFFIVENSFFIKSGISQNCLYDLFTDVYSNIFIVWCSFSTSLSNEKLHKILIPILGNISRLPFMEKTISLASNTEMNMEMVTWTYRTSSIWRNLHGTPVTIYATGGERKKSGEKKRKEINRIRATHTPPFRNYLLSFNPLIRPDTFKSHTRAQIKLDTFRAAVNGKLGSVAIVRWTVVDNLTRSSFRRGLFSRGLPLNGNGTFHTHILIMRFLHVFCFNWNRAAGLIKWNGA